MKNNKKKIWAHSLVCNEENFIWFALMSVVDYVDKILIWDTGSSDKTISIIEEAKKIKKDKIYFKEVGKVDEAKFSQMRQAMLDVSDCDWIIILDGDEVWWEKSIRLVVEIIQKEGDQLDSIATPFYNVVGDIYHYQEEVAGRYKIGDQIGHLTIRAINRNISSLHVEKPYGQEGFYNGRGVTIQNLPSIRRKFLKAPFLHLTNLPRSSEDQKTLKRSFKLKHEIGKSFPKDFKYPEVFYKPKPKIAPSPWKKMKVDFLVKSVILTVPRKIKRRLLRVPSGY